MDILELIDIMEESFVDKLQDEMKKAVKINEKIEISFCEGQLQMLEDVFILLHNLKDQKI